MQRSYFDTKASIVALATAPGPAALAIIRGAGPSAFDFFSACFSDPEALLSAPSRSLVYGELRDPQSAEAIDEVLVSVFRAPQGPLGEDLVEISCHGSPIVVRRALKVLEAAGFVPALPGEFSFRSFLHGKTDLLRSEAVQELVAADSEGGRAEALRRLEGGLSRRVSQARTSLVSLLAEVEARLDYAEEDDSPSGGLDSRLLRQLYDDLHALSSSYSAGRLYSTGARLVVAGRPNAGKSSLFNLLVREDRSIVSEEAGTTRDWIESRIELDGLPVRLIDTAGLRDASSSVEAIGVQRSLKLIEEAEAILYLVDGSQGLVAEDEDFILAHPEAVRVWNKTDQPSCLPPPAGFIAFSAAQGLGLPDLVARLIQILNPSFGREDREKAGSGSGTSGLSARERRSLDEAKARLASERQKLLLDRALQAMDSALAGQAAGQSLDIVVLDLREAADALGEMTGEIASEEVLTEIFSRFCLGK